MGEQVSSKAHSAALPRLSSFNAEQTAALTRIQAGARGPLTRKKIQLGFSKEDEMQLAKVQAAERALVEKMSSNVRRSSLRPGQQYHNLVTNTESDEAKLQHLQTAEADLLVRKRAAERDLKRRR